MYRSHDVATGIPNRQHAHIVSELKTKHVLLLSLKHSACDINVSTQIQGSSYGAIIRVIKVSGIIFILS